MIELVRARGDLALVLAVDVERLSILRWPERAVVDRQHAQIVGESLQHQRIVGRERRTPGRVVQAHTRGHERAGFSVDDPELEGPVGSDRLGGIAALDLDIAEHEAVARGDRDVRALHALPREPRAIHGKRQRLNRGPRRGRHRLRGLRLARAAVPVPRHDERRRELRHIGHREGHRLVDVEREVVIDVERHDVAEDALLPLDLELLQQVSRARARRRRRAPGSVVAARFGSEPRCERLVANVLAKFGLLQSAISTYRASVPCARASCGNDVAIESVAASPQLRVRIFEMMAWVSRLDGASRI